VKIFKSTTPADKLVEQVTLMMTMMVILFLAGIFFLNRFIFGSLWKDFFEALEKLKKFDVVKEPIKLGEPDVEEFLELKSVLERMTQRLSSDYKELREYTDHTTHELQTPLAVIKTKTELLLQSSHLGPDEMQLIQAINSSADHLSRLNSTLALITRIENQQYTDMKKIDLVEVLKKQLDMFQELIAVRTIRIKDEFTKHRLTVVMDEGLAGILVTNLLKNAIVHNRDGGEIIIAVKEGTLHMANQGDPLTFPETNLFKRFARDTRKTGNFGLGLSIVKKICDYYGYSIEYHFQDPWHQFQIEVSDYSG
jgi:signal transduction histidine kinase